MRVAVIAVILGGLARTALAQPAPDTARAKELYKSAEAAMQAKDYASAIRDYGGAYEITRDPVLFYKIGTANESAGKCPVAVIYYRRYIAEAKPTPAFVDITNARIKACEPAKSEPAKPEPAKPAPAKPEPAKPEPAKPAPAEPTKPAPAKPEPAKPAPAKPAPAKPAGKPVATDEPAKDDAKTAMGGFVGSREHAANTTALPAKNRAAWLFVTGSIALVTVGAVLAYSADSAENDVSDLYVGFGGTPPVFDRETKALYDDMIAEGQRYERLSWLSFGLAGATAATAAVLFWREHRHGHGEHATVTPTVSKDGAGVSAIVRF